jgi:hypothetical protein
MAKCRNLTKSEVQAMNWIRVSTAVGGFLVIGLILAIVMIRKDFKTVIERLFIYLLLIGLLREAVLFSNIEHRFEYRYMDEVCGVLGALNHCTSHMVIVIVAATVFYVLGRVVGWKMFQQKSKTFSRHFEVGFVVSTFFIPLGISVGLLYTDIFGLSIAWCWIKQYNDNCVIVDDIHYKKIFGGYSLVFLAGVLNIFLTAALITIYCKITRRVRGASHLLRQPLILLLTLIVNLFLLVISSIIITTPIESNYITLYVYTIVVSLYDIIYPVGFLISLKYQTLQTLVNSRRRQSSYSSLKSNLSPTSPFSDRLSARSTTVPITAPYTGEFTIVEDVY